MMRGQETFLQGARRRKSIWSLNIYPSCELVENLAGPISCAKEKRTYIAPVIHRFNELPTGFAIYGEPAARRGRPAWQKAAEAMDLYALAQYRGAMAGLLNAHWTQGYARLLWAAMCSPQRTSKRIYRAVRRQKKSSPIGSPS